MQLKILVNGAFGKMGQEVAKAVTATSDLKLVAESGKNDDLKELIASSKPHIVIDFTLPKVAFANAKIIIDKGVHPVIGTTGFTQQELDELQTICAQKKLGAVIAPNFSLGAVLMMKYAADAAKYFNKAEIIELHHEQKLDTPSGTAKKTAIMMAANNKNQQHIPIHSIRLPGIIANQEVIFGNAGETLHIHHRTIDRTAFMPGVILACKKVVTLQHLVYGLEQLID